MLCNITAFDSIYEPEKMKSEHLKMHEGGTNLVNCIITEYIYIYMGPGVA